MAENANGPDVVLKFIIDYKLKNDGCAPSRRQIARAVGLGSPSTAQQRLERLETAGKIRLLGQNNGIAVVGGKWGVE